LALSALGAFAMTVGPLGSPPRRNAGATIAEMPKGTRGRLVGVADEPPISCGCAAKCRALAASPGPENSRGERHLPWSRTRADGAETGAGATFDGYPEAGRVVAFPIGGARSG